MNQILNQGVTHDNIISCLLLISLLNAFSFEWLLKPALDVFSS